MIGNPALAAAIDEYEKACRVLDSQTRHVQEAALNAAYAAQSAGDDVLVGRYSQNAVAVVDDRQQSKSRTLDRIAARYGLERDELLLRMPERLWP